jgi:chemotaxis family two-component system sensor histidine kinase/response regulator PixL
MLTSRSSEKHRQLAMHLGAKHYFTKPYIEQEFLATIKNILMADAPIGGQALPLSR